MKVLILRVILLALSLLVYAMSYSSDNVLYYSYQSNRVYPLPLNPLLVTQLRLLGVNQIDNVYCGDPDAWEIKRDSVHPNWLMLKPKRWHSNSNLIILADANTYLFHLSVVRNQPLPSWYVVEVSARQKKRSVAHRLRSHEKREYDVLQLSYRGDLALKPLWAFSKDGKTYVKWPKQTMLPAVYHCRDGGSYLVNFRIKNRVMMLPFSSGCVLLKRGKHTANLLFPTDN